jgi:phosphate transport system protein
MSHYEERLENDIGEIRTAVKDLASSVLVAQEKAIEALLSGDEEIAHETVFGDHPINRNSRKLDWYCHTFIARHLPSAKHLRLMSSVVRVNVALERIGDYAVTIARESLQLSEPPHGKIARQLAELAKNVTQLLSDSIDAFVEEDADRVSALMEIPVQIEADMDGIYDRFLDSKKRSSREIVAIFVVFSLLKRVADQSKNICDQALFAIRSEIKGPSSYKFLFIDETNGYRSQMAAAIASKRYSDFGVFDCAGLEPAGVDDPDLTAFLDKHGIDTEDLCKGSIDSIGRELSGYSIVVSLDKKIKKYLPQLPFHTTALRWNISRLIDDVSKDDVDERYEATYRVLTQKIDELMHVLVGDDVG